MVWCGVQYGQQAEPTELLLLATQQQNGSAAPPAALIYCCPHLLPSSIFPSPWPCYTNTLVVGG